MYHHSQTALFVAGICVGAIVVSTLTILALLAVDDCHPFETDYVIDGDTLITTEGETLRLSNIDTPEKGEDGAHAATERLKQLVRHDTCYIDHGNGYYDRTIADIRVSASDILLDENLAKPYR